MPAVVTPVARKVALAVTLGAGVTCAANLGVWFLLKNGRGGPQVEALLLGTALASLGAAWLAYRTLTAAVIAPVREIADRATRLSRNCIAGIERIASGMAQGDLTGTLDATTTHLAIRSSDEIGQLAETINGIIRTSQRSIESLMVAQRTVQAVVTETASLNRAAEQGDFSQRVEAQRHPGTFAEMAQGINRAMDAVSLPLQEATAVLQRAAARDLSARMRGQYQGAEYVAMQQALNTALGNLDHALGEVTAAADQVASAGVEIRQGSDSLAHGAADQAATLEQTSHNLSGLTTMAHRNADSAVEAQALVRDARTLATRGVTWIGRRATLGMVEA